MSSSMHRPNLERRRAGVQPAVARAHWAPHVDARPRSPARGNSAGQLPWLRVWAEPPPAPGVAENPPPEKPREDGSSLLEPYWPYWPRPGRTRPGSKRVAAPSLAVTFDAGCERPWMPTAARMARKTATLVPPTTARVRLTAAARRARVGA